MIRVKKNDLLYLLSELAADRITGGVKENLQVFAGPKDDPTIVIGPGLKIRHMDSGIVYTVSKVAISTEGDPKIYCYRPGKEIVILPDHFKDYERL